MMEIITINNVAISPLSQGSHILMERGSTNIDTPIYVSGGQSSMEKNEQE